MSRTPSEWTSSGRDSHVTPGATPHPPVPGSAGSGPTQNEDLSPCHLPVRRGPTRRHLSPKPLPCRTSPYRPWSRTSTLTGSAESPCVGPPGPGPSVHPTRTTVRPSGGVAPCPFGEPQVRITPPQKANGVPGHQTEAERSTDPVGPRPSPFPSFRPPCTDRIEPTISVLGYPGGPTSSLGTGTPKPGPPWTYPPNQVSGSCAGPSPHPTTTHRKPQFLPLLSNPTWFCLYLCLCLCLCPSLRL